jgi:phosphohistidine phosphatase SixA
MEYMLLHIVRHPRAKPEDDTVNDTQRQVTKSGAKKFLTVLKLYAKANEMNPDVIFCGPETRNMQSGEIARDFFNLEQADVVRDPNLGVDGDAKKVFADIKDWVSNNGDDKNSEVLVIGSNPTLAELFQLVHGLGTKAGQSGSVKLKKGSVAKLKVYKINGDTPSSELRSYVPPGLAGA